MLTRASVLAFCFMSFASAARAQFLPPAIDHWRPAVPEPAYLPTSANQPKFPLQVRVDAVYGRFDGMVFRGQGTLHILNLASTEKDYTFLCSQTFIPARNADFYEARWKKPGRKLQLVMRQKPGSNQTRTCTLTLQ